MLHQAELIAVMSETIRQPAMEYGEEEGYLEFAKQMRDAAATVVKGCRNNDFETASNAANLIGQTCTNCHEEWR